MLCVHGSLVMWPQEMGPQETVCAAPAPFSILPEPWPQEVPSGNMYHGEEKGGIARPSHCYKTLFQAAEGPGS